MFTYVSLLPLHKASKSWLHLSTGIKNKFVQVNRSMVALNCSMWPTHLMTVLHVPSPTKQRPWTSLMMSCKMSKKTSSCSQTKYWTFTAHFHPMTNEWTKRRERNPQGVSNMNLYLEFCQIQDLLEILSVTSDSLSYYNCRISVIWTQLIRVLVW